MNVKTTFDKKIYELTYNEQSGFYEVELEAPETGGIYNAEVSFIDLIDNTETYAKKIQIWAKAKIDNTIQGTLVYFLSKTDLSIKDVLEFEDYEYVIDEETNKNTIFINNCSQNYNIVLDFSYVSGKIKLTIYKQENVVQLIDTTIADISNYVEKFETNVIAKVVVKTDTDIQKWYLLSDRTTTQNKSDINRATGNIEVVYTSKAEDARQTALDKFKSNTYNHYISFSINRNSKLFDVEKMKIGTPLSVRTNNNIILDTYISAIKDDGSNFIEITCGNMRVNFIDKILKERNK